MLLYDDFQIVTRSLTWTTVRANLWTPANEHVMPLGRLSTWLLVQLAGSAAVLPLVTSLQGPLAVVLGMALLGQLVRRELGHPFYGLVAMLLFGVTTVYVQAVNWFAASFAVLALDTTLLALLAAQHGRRSARSRHLALCDLACAASTAWFASGIVAGPLCCLYLLRSTGGLGLVGMTYPPETTG